jgi:hypothetical protein
LIPLGLGSGANTLIFGVIPDSWCRAWDTVFSVKILVTNALISIPEGFRGLANTFVGAEIPFSWFRAWLAF